MRRLNDRYIFTMGFVHRTEVYLFNLDNRYLKCLARWNYIHEKIIMIWVNNMIS